MQEPQQANIFPEAVKEVRPTIRAASDTDILTRDFVEKLDNHDFICDELDRVGVNLQDNIKRMFYYFHYVDEKVTYIELYVCRNEGRSALPAWQDVKKASLGRFLRIKDLSKTEIEYKHLIS